MTDAKRHAPSQPTKGKRTIINVFAKPMLPNAATPATAVKAMPVGNDDTCPNPAPHHPDAYEDTTSRTEELKGTIWPTDTEPFNNSEREPIINMRTSVVHKI